MGLFVTWLVAGLSVMGTAWLLPGVHVTDFSAALWAALAIGLANAVVRPLMVLLTLPVTLLTLGLFLLVINGLMIELADAMISGFRVDGLLWAMVASLVFSATSSLLETLLLGPEED